MRNNTLIKQLLPLVSLLMAGPARADCTPSTNISVTKPDSIYTDNFDGTVTDTITDLVWAKCSLGQTWVNNTPNDGGDDQCEGIANPYFWKTAFEAALSANDSNYLGQTDWRLPNDKELESLTDKACFSPAINVSVFPATVIDIYATSSPYEGTSSIFVWAVYFGDGRVMRDSKKGPFRVRLVREYP